MEKLASGKLLIAEPFLGDPNFERAVILLCDHNENGSFGFVLNQASNFHLADLIDKTVYPDIKVNIGGPVQRNTLHFIHVRPDLVENGHEIKKGLFWAGDFQAAIEKLNLGILGPNEIKFFIGYTGWSQGQLNKEMDKNSWILAKATNENIIQNNGTDFWRNTLKKLGGDFRVMSNYPIDPRLN